MAICFVWAIILASLSVFALVRFGDVLSAWVMGFFFLVCLFLGTPPLLVSGRYRLTNLRFQWKPRLGAPCILFYPEFGVPRFSVWPRSSTMFIRGRYSVTMPFIGNPGGLWGGLILMTVLGRVDVGQGSPIKDVAWWYASYAEGYRASHGIAILRPDYIAFVPIEASDNPAALAFKLAGAIVGVHSVTVKARLPLFLLLPHVQTQSPQEFDQTILTLVHRFCGVMWGCKESTVERLPTGAGVSNRSVDDIWRTRPRLFGLC